MPHLESSIGGPTGDVVCKKCNEESATQEIRSEKVCQKCFSQYVTTKAIKRMETYRIRGSVVKAARKLLLPLSLGPSSASLLHILDRHLQAQHDRMNRVAYDLFVVHIDLFLDSKDTKHSEALLEKYKIQYPRHNYASIGLNEALTLDGLDWNAMGLSNPAQNEPRRCDKEMLQELISSLPSATSRADVVSTLLTRLLVDVAKKNECESILFGDSTTKLAERMLTQTAKGRGFSLPWQVSDGISPYGVVFNYPLRDVLKKELVTFSSLSENSLSELVVYQAPSNHISASAKTTSIDDLMTQYFESVEENYPSIVANVVRTSSKLNPSTSAATSCSFCGLPVAEGTDGIFGWGGDQNSTSRPAGQGGNTTLCYGCSRTFQPA